MDQNTKTELAGWEWFVGGVLWIALMAGGVVGILYALRFAYRFITS